ncbi:MAG: hypothetical protein ACRC5R_00390 [Mycoplasmatales bacterium]
MKKLLGLVAISVFLLAGCSSGSSISVETDMSEAGDYSSAVAEINEDKIEKITLDAFKAESKMWSVQGSKDGNYPCCDASPYFEQVADVEAYIVKNQKFPLLDESGKNVDGSTSATIDLSQFKEAYEQVMADMEK